MDEPTNNLADKIYVSSQQRDLGEPIALFTGELGKHRRVGVIYNADSFPDIDDRQGEEMDEFATLTAEKIVRAYNSYDLLLKACEKALPYLRNHVAMTRHEGPGDRIALDLCEQAIAQAKEGFTDERTFFSGNKTVG